VRLTDFLNSAANIAGLLLWVLFMVMYIAYGNRLRAPAGRAFMIMSLGYLAILIPLLLHHPLGLSTDVVTWVAWTQFAGVGLSCVGTAWLIVIGIRANGRFPWQRK
jgi:hypothetical protein